MPLIYHTEIVRISRCVTLMAHKSTDLEIEEFQTYKVLQFLNFQINQLMNARKSGVLKIANILHLTTIFVLSCL